MNDVIVCTIVAANYLPQAMRLRESLLSMHPGTDFRVLLVEQPDVVAEIAPRIGARILGPNEIGCDDWLAMAFYYDCMELSTALKPFFIRTLLQEGHVVYLDPDIEVLGDLGEIFEAVRMNDVALTPHLTEPLPADGRRPELIDFIRVGQFNLGFLGVGRSECSLRLMEWWGNTLVENCASDLRRDLFTDQVWASLLVSFADRCAVLRSRRHNVAYWNVMQRDLRLDPDGTWMTTDGPVSFFHYSGLDPGNIEAVSRHQDRVRCEKGSDLYRILDGYAQRLARSSVASFRHSAYSFGHFRDGSPIFTSHRRTLLAISPPNRRAIADPFSSRGEIERYVECTPHLLPSALAAEDPTGRIIQLEQMIQELEARLGLRRYLMVDELVAGMNRVPGLSRVARFLVFTAWRIARGNRSALRGTSAGAAPRKT
jgi:hypothetical protein